MVFCKDTLVFDIVTFNELIIQSGSSLFHKIQSPAHCLNLLLPVKKIRPTDYELASTNTSYHSVILMF